MIYLKINEFIGEEYVEKYSDIMPIIRVIVYHLDVGKKDALFYPYNNFYLNRWSIKVIIYRIFGMLIYFMSIIYNLFTQNSESDVTLISDTLMYIDRYNDFVDEVIKNGTGQAILTQGASSKYFLELLHGKKNKYFSKRKINFGISVTGRNLNEKVEMVYDLFSELCQKQLMCTEKKELVEHALDELQVAANKRVHVIEKKVKKNKIKLFLTINQLYLNEALLIMACRKAGVWTKEISHFSECVVPISNDKRHTYFDNNYTTNVMFVNESCQWNENEIGFYRKYRESTNIYNENIILTAVGCPEITIQSGKAVALKQKKENIIMLVIPSELDYLGAEYRYIVTEETKTLLYKKREKLYEQIWKVATKFNMKVYVRYHPTEHCQYIENERELLSRYGFILQTTRQELFEYLAKSRVVFGKGSLLVAANIFGCETYAIRISDEKYDFCGMDISVVSVEQISQIDIYKEERLNCIKEELCINIDKVLRIPV